MKREDIIRIFEGAAKEQIDEILNLNSADIGKAKTGSEKLQADLDAANNALKEAQDAIQGLEAAKGDAEKLQKQINDYKAADEKRLAAEKAAAERAELMSRMDAAMAGRKFIHDRMRDVVADDFKAALIDKTNLGKADKEIFDAITKDQGYFASQNPPAGEMGPIGYIDPVDSAKLSDAEYYARTYAR